MSGEILETLDEMEIKKLCNIIINIVVFITQP